MPTEREVIADEARFINLPAVTADAAEAVRKTKALFSDPKYVPATHKLEMLWLPEERFSAWAAVRPGNPQKDSIGISYGAAREIYRDAFVLPQFCEKHFASPHYAPVYSALSYGDGIKRVLPSELSTDGAKVRIMNSTLAWLYLHEQSHLFQNHGLIAAALGATWANNDNCIDEMRDREGEIVTGKSAALSHMFELAADHEALNNVIGLMLKANRGSLPAQSLWTLVVGLTCMFQRFYGLDDRTYSETVVGTHPDPSFRMRILLREMTLLVMHPQVRKYAPWIAEQADLEAVLDHAVVTAGMYCQIRYRGDHGVSAFVPGVQGHAEVPKPYQQALFDVWTEARPMVLSAYRGWGEECVLTVPRIALLS